jgi:hypothetical protein
MLSFRNLARSTGATATILAILVTLIATSDFGKGPAAVHSAETDVDHLTVIYHSDCKGKIEPCG